MLKMFPSWFPVAAGLGVVCVVVSFLLGAAIPSGYARDVNVVWGGECFIVEGAVPDQYGLSIKAFVADDPGTARRTLSWAPTNCNYQR